MRSGDRLVSHPSGVLVVSLKFSSILVLPFRKRQPCQVHLQELARGWDLSYLRADSEMERGVRYGQRVQAAG